MSALHSPVFQVHHPEGPIVPFEEFSKLSPAKQHALYLRAEVERRSALKFFDLGLTKAALALAPSPLALHPSHLS